MPRIENAFEVTSCQCAFLFTLAQSDVTAFFSSLASPLAIYEQKWAFLGGGKEKKKSALRLDALSDLNGILTWHVLYMVQYRIRDWLDSSTFMLREKTAESEREKDRRVEWRPFIHLICLLETRDLRLELVQNSCVADVSGLMTSFQSFCGKARDEDGKGRSSAAHQVAQIPFHFVAKWRGWKERAFHERLDNWF